LRPICLLFSFKIRHFQRFSCGPKKKSEEYVKALPPRQIKQLLHIQPWILAELPSLWSLVARFSKI